MYFDIQKKTPKIILAFYLINHFYNIQQFSVITVMYISIVIILHSTNIIT